MKQLLTFFNTFCFTFFLIKPVFANFTDEMAETPQQVLISEWAVDVLIFALVGGIIYSILRAIQIYGGLIGNSLKILGLGIFFLAVESVNRVLERFGVNYLRDTLGPGGEELFFAIFKAAALLILAIGFQKLTTISHKPPKEK